jgi:NAD(P)-dependent dehydrogenase (short-subunit alcohol dehydrogenase family)
MNNAAVLGPVKPLGEVRESEWNRVFGVNLKGPLLLSKAVIPHMAQQRKGKIINVTSGLGEMTLPFFGPYSMTKAALIHLTRILAGELRTGNIQVNGLDPGVMDTRMQEDARQMGPEILGDETYHRFTEMKKRGLLTSPERVAALAVFLASSEANHITGENGTEADFMKFGYRAPRR